MTRLLFDFLVEQLPDGPSKSDIAELRDHNVLMLDLRDLSQDLVVKTIIDNLPNHLGSLDPELQSSFQPGFVELLQLASAQYLSNQSAAP